MRLLRVCLLSICLFAEAFAAEQLHLLGFVDSLCPNQAHCFSLRVEADSSMLAGQQLRVRYSEATSIFDPENYRLTLAQSNIIPGSHLRLLITRETDAQEPDYHASYIWIGD